MSKSCKAPTCQYSEARGKCVRPNAYIEHNAWCKRNNIEMPKCKERYNKKEAQKEACNRYYERLQYVSPIKKKRCPEGKELNPKTNRCRKIRAQKVERKKTSQFEPKSSSLLYVPPNTPLSSRKSLSSHKSSSSSHRISPIRSTSSMSRAKMTSSEYRNMFARNPIERKNAIYLQRKQNAIKISESDEDLMKDSIIRRTGRTRKLGTTRKQAQKPEQPNQNVFLKDIFDDNKKIMKEMSSLEMLPIDPKTPKEISRLSEKIQKLREKNAANKIKNFIIQNILKRVETVDDRLKYYTYIRTYLKDTNAEECIEKKQYRDEKRGIILDGFKVGDFLNLVKRIGSDSKYGVVYRTETKKRVLLTLATKLMPIYKDNSNEVKINAHVSDIVKYKLSKHFLLSYKTFVCKKPSDDYDFPNIIRHTNYYLSLNELAHGDLRNLILNQVFLENNAIVMNVALQCILGIATFHSCGYTHNDTHYGNFLYHSYKTSGEEYYEYSIYGKTYYIKNCGYNMMIYDFGFIKKMNKTSTSYGRIIYDYYRVLYSFRIRRDKQGGWIDNYPSSYVKISSFFDDISRAFLRSEINKESEDNIIHKILDLFQAKDVLSPNLIKTSSDNIKVVNKGAPYIITTDIYSYCKSAGIPFKAIKIDK